MVLKSRVARNQNSFALLTRETKLGFDAFALGQLRFNQTTRTRSRYPEWLAVKATKEPYA
jgi:hypothetical protein